jgi:uncharacterized protein (TIGR02217 family)
MSSSIIVMSDLVFRHNVISAALRGRNIRKNQRVTTANGFESINIVWDSTLREYDITTIQLFRSDWDYIETFHEITEGGAYGFLLEDPKDFYTTSATAYIATAGVMAALGGGTYQLYKRKKHIASARYKDRKITRVNASTFQALDAGGNPLSGTVNPDTGIATITGTPVTWTGRFYVPVHFQSDIIDWTLEASGPEEVRMYSGPSVIFEQIRE